MSNIFEFNFVYTELRNVSLHNKRRSCIRETTPLRAQGNANDRHRPGAGKERLKKPKALTTAGADSERLPPLRLQTV